MRYWIYDEDDMLIRKFHMKEDAIKFLQDDWRLEVQPKVKKRDILEEMMKDLGESPI